MNNILDSLIFKHKIFLLLVLPMLSIIFLSSMFIYSKYEQRKSVITTSEYIKFNYYVNDLILHLQKERELTYLQEYKEIEIIKNNLKKQRVYTDESFKKFKKNLLSLNISSIKNNNIIFLINTLVKNRTKIDNKTSTLVKIKQNYSLSIKELFTFIDNTLRVARNEELISLAQEYIFLSQAKEYFSQEKFLVEYIFNNGRLSNNDFITFISLVSSENIYLFNIKKYASKEDIKILSKLENKNILRLISVIKNKNKKNKLLANIKELAGYGGLIHNFKNYILRGDEKYSSAFQQKHSNLIKNINKYRRLKPLSKDEKNELENIKNIFDEYLDYSLEVQDALALDKSIEELDILVQIDDSIAINSIKNLTKNIYGNDVELWNKEANKSISIYNNLLQNVLEKMSKKSIMLKNDINNKLLILSILIVLLFLCILLLSKVIIKRIEKKLYNFQEGLTRFFSFSLGKRDTLKLMKVKGKDEFALMTKDINKQIIQSQEITKKDKIVIDEINDVMAKVSNGFFSYEIYNDAGSKEVEALKDVINKMIRYTKSKIDIINKVLTSYSFKKYDYLLEENDKRGMNGDFGILLNSLILLGDSSSVLVALITNASKKLDKNAKTLTRSSSTLSSSSTLQAASLEETAASIEEITSNMQSSLLKVNDMSILANSLTSSSQQGNILANKTALCMEEINQKVISINAAISVIDKIAFQTNILSLNAAVEAATAGEAGRGFAVVAGEVRNLASRSAHAAKEIKTLVHDAALKSHEGKNTANEMISGYLKLISKVDETKIIIDEVTLISNEQKEGMVQINDAINSLDKTTQKNANISLEIDTLSKEIDSLSLSLHSITSIITIDEKYLKRVGDLSLLSKISKYKNDHINFKKESFKDLNLFKSSKASDAKSCDLGAWISSCEKQNKTFVKSQAWEELLIKHHDVHEAVYLYLEANHKKDDNKKLANLASKIEVLTINIFDLLNDILELNVS